MANMTYFESGPRGISHPATGKTSTWDNFYRGILPSPSSSGRPTASQMQAIRAVPSDRGPASMSRAEMDQFNRQYSYFPGPVQNPAVAAINTAAPPALGPGPGPMPRPGYAPTAIDMAAINGMPAPVAPPMPAAPPPPAPPPAGGGQLAALLEAAKGLGGLLSGVTGNIGGPAKPAPTAADYNTQRKAGMTDWKPSMSGAVYSPTLMDKQTGYNKPGAKKTGRGNSKHTGAGK